MEKGVEFIAPRAHILVDYISACSSTQAEIPDSNFAYLQSWPSSHIWPESFVGISAWFGSPTDGPYWPWSLYGSHGQWRKFTVLPNWWKKASSPTRLKSWAATEPILQLHSGKEPSQKLCPTVEHNLQPYVTRDLNSGPKQLQSPAYLTAQPIALPSKEPHLQLCLIIEHSMWPCPGKQPNQ